jgi:ABC-2 type transport system permease protein
VRGMFLATWIGLRRPAVLVSTYLSTAAITAVVMVLTLAFADQSSGPQAANGIGRTPTELASPAGGSAGMSISVFGFGIILFCVAAASYGGYWTTGTLQGLLVRQPRRARFLVGTWAALVSFAAGAVVVATLASLVVGRLLASRYGIAAGAWFTLAGARATLLAIGRGLLACVGYQTLGAALGVLLRRPVPAVAIGFGWLFIIESLVPQAAPGAYRWLPGQVLGALAAGGSAAVSFPAAAVTATVYLAAAVTAAAVSFTRGDVAG